MHLCQEFWTQDQQKALAVVRKPPGKGPFPAVIHLHGGLGRNSVEKSKQLLHGQTFSRFRAAGYVTIAVTFRIGTCRSVRETGYIGDRKART